MTKMPIVILFALSAGGAMYYQNYIQPPPAQFAGGVDTSGSVNRDCAGLAKEIQRLMTKENGTRDGSALTLLGIGVSRETPQAQRLFDKPLPGEPDSVFGQADGQPEKAMQDYFDGVRSACEAAPASPSSPVLRLVIDGVDHLRGREPNPKGRRFLVVMSDLMDDTDARLRGVIERARRNPAVELPPSLARSIANTGTSVEFCGTSQAQPRRRGARPSVAPETLRRIYLGLFTQPELVSFRGFCGQ